MLIFVVFPDVWIWQRHLIVQKCVPYLISSRMVVVAGQNKKKKTYWIYTSWVPFFLILGDKNSLFPVDPRVVGSMNPFQNEISPFTRQIYTFLSEAVFKTPVVPL